MSLFKAEGLSHNADGILGLSPHKEERKKKFHFLWSLKHNKIIDHAIVSFSVTKSTWADKSYALFGGYNSTQIVGGASGLKTFKNYPNWLGTWALRGEGIFYNDVTL